MIYRRRERGERKEKRGVLGVVYERVQLIVM